jgi:hypothetical protein
MIKGQKVRDLKFQAPNPKCQTISNDKAQMPNEAQNLNDKNAEPDRNGIISMQMEVENGKDSPDI